jgi:hypothetical protein
MSYIQVVDDDMADKIIGVMWNTGSDSPALQQIDIDGDVITKKSTAWFDRHPVWGGMKRCTLSEAQTKKINDIGIGKNVTSKIPVDDQIAAIRKQLILVSEAVKVPLDKDFQALEDLVASEKAKKEKKVETVKPKKASAKKSK